MSKDIVLFGATEQFDGNASNLSIPDVRASGRLIDSIVEQVFIGVGALALLMLLIGAFFYVTSAGDSSKVEQAKNTMLYAIVGLIIAVSAFVIIQFVSNRVTG